MENSKIGTFDVENSKARRTRELKNSELQNREL